MNNKAGLDVIPHRDSAFCVCDLCLDSAFRILRENRM